MPEGSATVPTIEVTCCDDPWLGFETDRGGRTLTVKCHLCSTVTARFVTVDGVKNGRRSDHA